MEQSTRGGIAALLLVCASAVALAHDGAGDENVTPLARAALPDAPGTQAQALRVDFAPGATSKPHRHPGPVFVVVVDGEVESALDGGPVVHYKAGDTWYEAPGQVHSVTRNASKTRPARLVAWLLSDGKTPLVTPLPVDGAAPH
ncbi:cupin domain-containing protein [Crenobacter sp. SG2303]|uniref:Cupin domain-containing protein n=1 Tax=Crenobacter oryzisoli TaxID=3056844 RepID=A0ABT7XIZ3_9NEIS|nr:cupin domain-containing protein [Crenobacter sp. SG2303]MDN0073758.1 cupin domain-containing protein [Crenobacter sp. SG2303]